MISKKKSPLYITSIDNLPGTVACAEILATGRVEIGWL
jgi:hypothetical protein